MHIYVHSLTINYRLTLCGCGRKKRASSCSNKDRGSVSDSMYLCALLKTQLTLEAVCENLFFFLMTC